MIHKPLSFALGLILLSFGWLQAQLSPAELMADPNLNLQQIMDQAQPYLASLRQANGGQITHTEKVFARWAAFWSSRMDQSGPGGADGIGRAMDYYQRLLAGEFPICSIGGTGWRSLGPESVLINQRYPSNIGVVHAIAVHPSNENIIYIGTNFSGLWKTVDGGQHWRNITDGLRIPNFPVEGLELDPLNPDIVWAGAGETEHNYVGFGIGLFKSTDAGATWTHVWPATTNYSLFNKPINVIRFSPNYASNHQMLMAGGHKILRSTDSGLSWVEVYDSGSQPNASSGNSFHDLEYSPTDPNLVMASTRCPLGPGSRGAQLVVSHDGGVTWSCLTCDTSPMLPFGQARSFPIAQSPFDGGLAVGFSTNVDQAVKDLDIVRTSDGLQFKHTRHFSTALALDHFRSEFEISPCDTNRFYLGGVNFGYYDQATNSLWLDGNFNIHADMRAMTVRCDGSSQADRVYIGTDGGLVKSIDSGHTLPAVNGAGLKITQYYAFDIFPKSGYIAAGAQDNGTHKLQDGQWYFRKAGDGNWTEVNQHPPYFAVWGDFERWRTTFNQFSTPFSSQGSDAHFLDLPIPADFPSQDFLGRRIVADHFEAGKFWTGNKEFLTAYDIQPGNVQSTVVWDRGPQDGRHLSDIGLTQADRNVMYLSYDGPFWGQPISRVLYVSHDRGVTFTDISLNLFVGGPGTDPLYYAKYVTDIEVDPMDAAHVFVGVAGYGWNTNLQQAVSRVYESHDFGATWQDMSKGLSPFPVSYLCYQNGTDDVLWAATDGGVYRYNKAALQWECFNNGLPATACTRVLVDYCRKRLLVSTFGRGMYEADLPATPEHHITSSQTWDASTIRYFDNTQIIDPGVTLVVKGTVYFAPGTRFVVSRGARLRVVGGTIAGSCGGMWKGIDVNGDVFHAQAINTQGLDPFHGIVDVSNGTIMGAQTAISTSRHDTQGNFYWDSFGGIVRCTQAKFINNQRDVEFMSYPQANYSYFRDCRFEIDTLLPNHIVPTTRVGLWNVRNIPFTGCTFKHAANSGYNDQERGAGIVAVDATYLVDWTCTSSGQNGCNGGVPSRFEGLEYGIHHECSNPLLSPSIRHSQFVWNTRKGVKLRGAHFAIVEDNNFDVGPNLNAAGLYLQSCTKYSVQGNTFTTTTLGDKQRYGLIVHASGDDLNRVYNNAFVGLPYALSAQEDNEGPVAKDGLVMNCNDFTNCGYGIMALGVTATAGVGDAQGYPVTANQASFLVRNRYFGQCAAANENKFLVFHPNQYTIQHLTNPNQECRPLPQPACSDVILAVTIDQHSLDRSLDCGRIGGNGLQTMESKITDAANRLAQQSSILASSIDGGNTNARLLFVQQTTQPGQLQSGLIQYSPYLSDTVLITVMGKVPLLPPGTIRAILLANSPLSPKVASRLSSVNLPSGIVSQILAAQIGTSPRQILENNMASASNDRIFWQDEKLRFLLHDTLTPTPQQDLAIAFAAYGYPVCYQKQVLALRGDLVAADSAMQGLATCTVDEPVFAQLTKQLRAVAKTCCVEDDRRAPMAHEAGQSCLPPIFPQAQTAIEQVLAWRSEETHLLPPVPIQKWLEDDVTSTEVVIPTFKLYPNPSQDVFFIEFEGDVNAKYSVLAYDMSGRLVGEQSIRPDQVNKIKLGKQTPGLYFYLVLKDGQPWKTGKIQLI